MHINENITCTVNLHIHECDIYVISMNAPIRLFQSRYGYGYSGFGYRPIPMTDPIPVMEVTGIIVLCVRQHQA